MASGWKVDNWLSNPVHLWGHKSDTLPIGKGVEYAIDNKSLVIHTKFAEPEVDYDPKSWPANQPSPDAVYRLHKSGFLKAVSVGFMPIKFKWEWNSEEERIAAGVGEYGILFEEQDLWELSSVSIPANPNALQLAAKSGIISLAEALAFRGGARGVLPTEDTRPKASIPSKVSNEEKSSVSIADLREHWRQIGKGNWATTWTKL